ncbi:MAG: hypothetical protein Kow0058_19130 [Roseovarius sp.]
MLWGRRVSRGTVSNLNKKISAKIDEWRHRRIEGEHPYVFLDGIVMKRSWAGEVRNVSLLVAIGVTTDGYREIPDIVEGPKKDKSGWSMFLRHLADRGLSGVQPIVSDPCRGLVESAAEIMPEARGQRCVVHIDRNLFSLVPSGKVRDIAKMLKAIHARENRQAAAEKMTAVIAGLNAQGLTRAARLREESGHETLTCYSFPDSHWIKLRTNNPLERIMREIRRRTRGVGAFPDGKSCLNLAAARLRRIAGTQWSSRKDMNMTRHSRIKPREPSSPPCAGCSTPSTASPRTAGPSSSNPSRRGRRRPRIPKPPAPAAPEENACSTSRYLTAACAARPAPPTSCIPPGLPRR